MGVDLTGVYLMGVDLIGVCLMRVSHRHVSHGRVPRDAAPAFGGRWPGVAFLILALGGKLGRFSLGALRSGGSTMNALRAGRDINVH